MTSSPWPRARHAVALVVVVVAPLLGGAPLTVTHYPVADGLGTAAVQLSDGRVASFRPSIYAALDDGLPVPELAYDAYVGVRHDGTSRWLTTISPVPAAVPDANALAMQQLVDGVLLVETGVVATWAPGFPGVVLAVHATNVSSSTLTGVSFPTIHNFRLGTGADANEGERATFDVASGEYREVGARGVLIARALGATLHHQVTPADPYPIVQNNQPYQDVDDSGVTNNVVHGFVFAPPGESLAPGASFRFGVLLAYDDDGSAGGVAALTTAITAHVAGRDAEALSEDLVDAQATKVAAALDGLALTTDERALAGWSLANILAAQVREADTLVPGRRPTGQIPASLPPGIWNIAWVRDGAYAIDALTRLGLVDEAAGAVSFMLHGVTGDYESYVGGPHLISVTRYYGGGREESDWNASGPNVEWDNFGLFLLTASPLVGVTPDVTAAVPAMKTGVADVLLDLVDPTTGLLVADSSIWETHWTPSFESTGRRQFTYSSAMAVAGLRAFADALDALDDADATLYRAGADALAAAILDELVTGGQVLASSREERVLGASFLDAAVVEALNHDVVAPTGPVASATLAALSALRAPNSAGYFRNDEGGEYDGHEWIVIDLWLSRAFRRSGDVDEAVRLLDHVTDVGLSNLGEIPELLHRDDGRAWGAIPMMGFGAGAYLSALLTRDDDTPAPTDGGVPADSGDDDDGGAPPDGGGGDAGGVIDDGGFGLDAGPGEDGGENDAGLLDDGGPMPARDGGPLVIPDPEGPPVTPRDPDGGPDDEVPAGCGCATTDAALTPWWLALLGIGLRALSRRGPRRRRGR